jgi:hypothetical protein
VCEEIAQSWNVQLKIAPPRTRMTTVCLAVALYSPVLLGLCGSVKVARAGVLQTVKKTSGEYTVIINDPPHLNCCELLC